MINIILAVSVLAISYLICDIFFLFFNLNYIICMFLIETPILYSVMHDGLDWVYNL